jgi:hypothetical protein
VPAIATAIVPPGQEGRFVRLEEAAATTMPRLTLRKRRALEVPPHGTPTEPDLVRDRIQRPLLPMDGPDLLAGRHPLDPTRGGEGHGPGGGLWGREWHGGQARGAMAGEAGPCSGVGMAMLWALTCANCGA